jgi:hypothetical protein
MIRQVNMKYTALYLHINATQSVKKNHCSLSHLHYCSNCVHTTYSHIICFWSLYLHINAIQSVKKKSLFTFSSSLLFQLCTHNIQPHNLFLVTLPSHKCYTKCEKKIHCSLSSLDYCVHFPLLITVPTVQMKPRNWPNVHHHTQTHLARQFTRSRT